MTGSPQARGPRAWRGSHVERLNLANPSPQRDASQQPTRLMRKMERRQMLARWLDHQTVRFFITGGLAAILFFLLSFGLMATGVGPFFASVVAYAVVIVFSYALQHQWTFRARHRHSRSLPRYLALQLCCSVGSGLIARTAVVQFGLSSLATSFATTVLVAAISYLGSSLWVFRHVEQVRE